MRLRVFVVAICLAAGAIVAAQSADRSKGIQVKRDPALIQALKSTREGVQLMRKALPIYHGHRVKAMKLSRLGIKQILLALKNAPADKLTAQQVAAKMGMEDETPLRKYTPQEIVRSHGLMRQARAKLVQAYAALGRAKSDYNGHRTSAQEFVRLAGKQIDEALGAP